MRTNLLDPVANHTTYVFVIFRSDKIASWEYFNFGRTKRNKLSVLKTRIYSALSSNQTVKSLWYNAFDAHVSQKIGVFTHIFMWKYANRQRQVLGETVFKVIFVNELNILFFLHFKILKKMYTIKYILSTIKMVIISRWGISF